MGFGTCLTTRLHVKGVPLHCASPCLSLHIHMACCLDVNKCTVTKQGGGAVLCQSMCVLRTYITHTRDTAPPTGAPPSAPPALVHAPPACTSRSSTGETLQRPATHPQPQCQIRSIRVEGAAACSSRTDGPGLCSIRCPPPRHATFKSSSEERDIIVRTSRWWCCWWQ